MGMRVDCGGKYAPIESLVCETIQLLCTLCERFRGEKDSLSKHCTWKAVENKKDISLQKGESAL